VPGHLFQEVPLTAAVLDDVFAPPSALPSRTEQITELVNEHLPLVGHLVRETLNRLPAYVNRDDLMSAGMLALVLSARSFDPSRGVPFGPYAAIRIRGALADELRLMDWASRAVRTKARETESVRATLAARLGRNPRREEIAQVMGVPVGELDALDADLRRAGVLSLQNLTPDESADLLPHREDGPEGLLLRREQVGMLHDAIAELPERLRYVVEQYFFAQRKMADIASELGVTESRVSQLRSEALTLLRAGLQDGTAEPASTTRAAGRAAARQAYRDAVATRSSLAHRLAVTTVLGEVHTGTGGRVRFGARRRLV
jgi:RNA polymerase sigma factor for flagellar operon FliA